MRKIYITTAIDYANGIVHIGHAYQKILADSLARYHRMRGDSVFFMTGTDEHGGNIEQIADKERKTPKEYVNYISDEDKKQWEALDISYDRFMRTTDEDHKDTAIGFWERCDKNGDIYIAQFNGMYCLGCESFKTEKEIVDGKCLLHPTKELQKVEEENYFFKWSKYQSFLIDLFEKNPDFVQPKSKQKEMLSFLKDGLEDISISRKNISWGIPVPGNHQQTIYVWFDALINYFSGALENGYWQDDTKIIHILGKDNMRWHALLWPAMLESAKYRLPDKILTHGFINLNGQKISKSLGNIIRPTELVSEFKTDAVRYIMLKYGPEEDDIDISLDKMKHVFNSELANDWGNLVSRVAKLCENNNVGGEIGVPGFSKEVIDAMEEMHIQKALNFIYSKVRELNEYINIEKPWEKSGEEVKPVLQRLVQSVRQIALDFTPFMPTTSEKIFNQFSVDSIIATAPVFERKK